MKKTERNLSTVPRVDAAVAAPTLTECSRVSDACDEQQLPRLLTYQEVHNKSGVPRGTLYDFVSKGRIPHVRLGKRLVRFVEGDVMAWLDAHKIDPDPNEAA